MKRFLRILMGMVFIMPWVILEMADLNGRPSDFGFAVGLACGMIVVPLFSKKPSPLWHTALVGVGLLALRLILSYPFHLAFVRR
jgi:uncharacterized membrane protein